MINNVSDHSMVYRSNRHELVAANA